jgi:hypothetical protein
LSRNQIIALVGCGGLLLIVFFWSGCALVVASIASRGQETSTPTAEETTEEVTEETTEETTTARQRVKRQGGGETTALPPPPQTPEERLRANIQTAFSGASTILQDAQIQNRNGQCYDIYVRFTGDAVLGSSYDLIEHRMADIYKAVYGDADLRNLVCTTRAEATTKFTDNRGNETRETSYVTNLDNAQAATLNWRNVDNINFPSVWTVEYEHPKLQQERAQGQLEHFRDCMDNGGLFDFDWLQCP